MQLFVASGATNHSHFSTDRRSADSAVDSRSTVYRKFRRVRRIRPDYTPVGLRQLHRRARAAMGPADSAVDAPVGRCVIRTGTDPPHTPAAHAVERGALNRNLSVHLLNFLPLNPRLLTHHDHFLPLLSRARPLLLPLRSHHRPRLHTERPDESMPSKLSQTGSHTEPHSTIPSQYL